MTRKKRNFNLSGLLPWAKSAAKRRLSVLFTRQTGKPSAKWQGYLSHYERWLGQFSEQPIRLLEIGVQGGGSLEIWAEHFRKAEVIVGCDIDPVCAELRYADSRIKVVTGNINEIATIGQIDAISPAWDVIIDDGSHHSRDIIQSFLRLFPRLSEDGVYLIEDLHCSYWGEYGGGLYHPQSAISFFKKVIDVVNQPAWGIDVEDKEFWAEFAALIKNVPAELISQSLRDIYRIEFADSMCMIQKRAAAQNGTGVLLLSGQQACDNRSPHHYTATELAAPDQSGNVLSQTAVVKSNAEQQLLKATEEIDRLKQENLRLQTQFYESTKKYYDASVKIQALEQKLAESTPHCEQQP